jgi:hypothetical protein
MLSLRHLETCKYRRKCKSSFFSSIGKDFKNHLMVSKEDLNLLLELFQLILEVLRNTLWYLKHFSLEVYREW